MIYKILHTGDWHLCAPMETVLPAAKAEERRQELLGRFSDMVSYAVENKIAAVLLCGDIADGRGLTRDAEDHVLHVIADAAPIRFYGICGNHDPALFANAVLPENLTMFGGDVWSSCRLFPAVTLTARAPTKGEVSFAALTQGFPVLSSADINLVMLHGALTDRMVFGGEDTAIPREFLRGRNIDYAALGHYHAFRYEKADERCTVCYAGCPEGRGFDECDEKGFVMLTIDDMQVGQHRLHASFVPFAKRILHDICMDISGVPANTAALEQAADAVLCEAHPQDIVRLTLTGDDDPDVFRDTDYLSKRLAERFYYAVLRDARTIRTDTSVWQKDISLKGMFVRAVLGADLPEDEKQAIITCGIDALRRG